MSSKSFLAAVFGLLLTIGVVPVAALDFSFRPVAIPCPGQPCIVNGLVGSGEIRSGDARRLREFLGARANAWEYLKYSFLFLDSPGGDVEEAIRLAQTLREIQAQVVSIPPMICASACFFLYVGAPKRFGWQGRSIAVHRPYFSANVTRKLSLAQAEAAHNAAFARAKRWLQDQLVPQTLIDKMFSLPSTEAYWLTEKEVEQLGTMAPWYEEWLLAKCPGYITLARYVEIRRAQGSEEAKRMLRPGARCEGDAKGAEVIAVLLRYERDYQLIHPGATSKGR